MIRDKYDFLKARGKPKKQTKYTETQNHLSFEKKYKLYDFYICDYCGNEIKIDEKLEHREGGVLIFKSNMTNRGKLELALHNKCLNNVLKEFENKKVGV